MKIGLIEALLLIILDILVPSGDVFADVRSSAQFFLTGRNCLYTNGATNWTYSECHILPKLEPKDLGCSDNEFTCPSGECIPRDWRCDGEDDCDKENCKVCSSNQFTCPSGECMPRNWKCDGDDDCDKENCKVFSTTTTSPTTSTTAQGPTKLVYVNYFKPWDSQIKYAIDEAWVPDDGWTPMFKFWAFNDPKNRTILISVGVTEDFRFHVQKGTWIPRDGWTFFQSFHVINRPGNGKKMFVCTDRSSRILEGDCVGDTQGWKEDFKFWAKEELQAELKGLVCCDKVAIISYGNSTTWRVEYLGEYDKEEHRNEIVASSGSHAHGPCKGRRQPEFKQKPPGRSILTRTGEGWAVKNSMEEFTIFAETKDDVACPDKAEIWTYPTDNRRTCADETLKTVCIKKDEDLTMGDKECKEGLEDGSVKFLCSGEPYRYFGTLILIPIVLTTLVTLKLWWQTEENAKNRLITFPLLLLQVWPQYRVVLIIFYGLKSSDNWKRLKEKHHRHVACIEPMYESVLQVNVTGSILFLTAGPWHDNINALYDFKLSTSLSSYFLSLFAASFGITNFLRVGPLRILPTGFLDGLLTWPFLAAFVVTLSSVFLKAFWVGIIIHRFAFYQNIDCVFSLSEVDFWEVSTGVAVAISIYYLPNILMNVAVLFGRFGLRKGLSIIFRIPVLFLIPGFTPFTFGFYYDIKKSLYLGLSFSRSLTIINTLIILIQTFIPPYVFFSYKDGDESKHWFYTDNFLLYTHHTVLVSSLMMCLPLVIIPTIILLIPRFPGCHPHLDIKTLNIDTWQNEENYEDCVLY